ncbi:MAG: thiamine pyrophosphate-binding protein, partial [Actinomycetota bacterium]
MTGPAPRAEATLPRAEVEEAALLLSLSARPVIWAGAGAAGAGEAVAAVARLLAAPVVTSFSGKGVLSEDEPLLVGSLFGASEVARLIGGADAALAVGTTFSARSTRKGSLPLPMQLFHVDLDPAVFSRAYPTRLGIPGEARAVLEALADR